VNFVVTDVWEFMVELLYLTVVKKMIGINLPLYLCVFFSIAIEELQVIFRCKGYQLIFFWMWRAQLFWVNYIVAVCNDSGGNQNTGSGRIPLTNHWQNYDKVKLTKLLHTAMGHYNFEKPCKMWVLTLSGFHYCLLCWNYFLLLCTTKGYIAVKLFTFLAGRKLLQIPLHCMYM
jgi:hypothetical protein